jgi:DNA-binding Lrp family transcriptional regulator
LEDEEGVIKGAHYYLVRQRSLDELEKEVCDLLRRRGPLPLSAIWRNSDCHLWEVSAVLTRLKEKGQVEESDVTLGAY